MGRALLTVSLTVLAGVLILTGQAMRYQYFSVVGPGWNVAATEVGVRRVDRWTGTPQEWVCRDVDTNRIADVPPPPSRPPDAGNPESTEAVARTGQYYIALSMWRSAFPSVNAQNLRVMKPVCAWEPDR
jgi:hypothetical protein